MSIRVPAALVPEVQEAIERTKAERPWVYNVQTETIRRLLYLGLKADKQLAAQEAETPQDGARQRTAPGGVNDDQES